MQGLDSTMLGAATHGDEEHATWLADLGSVPNTLGNDDRRATSERNLLKSGWLLQQQHGGTRQQINELLGLGMHLPVRPVRGALKLGDKPAMAKAIEFGFGHGPKALTARKLLRGATGSEMDVRFTGIEVHENLRFSWGWAASDG